MNIIKKKADILKFVERFEDVAFYDESGKKYYLVVDDKERLGIWTLMKYSNNEWTRHGKGENYSDEGETSLSEQEVSEFLWKNRSSFNKKIKELVTK